MTPSITKWSLDIYIYGGFVMWILFEQDRPIGVFDSKDAAWDYYYDYNEEARRKARPKLLVPHTVEYPLNPKVV